MTTPTLRDALKEIRGYCLLLPHPIPPSLLSKVDTALAAQPELPEPAITAYEDGFWKWNTPQQTHNAGGKIQCYTSAQLQQAAAQAKREPVSSERLLYLSSEYADNEDEAAGYRDGFRDAESHHNIGDKE